MITRLILSGCIFLQFISFNRTMANNSTACYGTPGIGCTKHKLICRQPLVISITNITFGYRQGCSIFGVSNCGNTTCCREQPGDCFTSYNQTLLLQQQQTCNGRSTCTLNRNNGLNEISPDCDFSFRSHSYSKIEYQCVTNASLSTNHTSSVADSTISSTVIDVQDTTTSTSIQIQESTPDDEATCINGEVLQSDKGIVVIIGGVLGTALIISISINILFVIYFNRRLKILKHESDVHLSEHQHYSTPSRGGDATSVVYDSLNANEGQRSSTIANVQIQSTNDSPQLTSGNGETQTEQNNRDYDHQYDSTTGRGPVAVYDSLNTREQTGYYNMGNINTTGT
ncbi:uncharacterized protein LOC126810263 [Patella vulgata]|uniref:uncharacterized protein LOC126810263 n=1 Tax=Patella vulgata TaxID=6465 RepID=UPI00218093E4|nr:uncharacterized protein LOC126810263 [Patella vulgata]XP_055954919.1 uncharacterized protein LOC126810263 [Patella vulgata]